MVSRGPKVGLEKEDTNQDLNQILLKARACFILIIALLYLFYFYFFSYLILLYLFKLTEPISFVMNEFLEKKK